MDDALFLEALKQLTAPQPCEAAGWARGPGVVGYGFAARSVLGRRTPEQALKVYVRRKLARSCLELPVPAFLRLPGLEPVPLDVEAIGELRPHGARLASSGAGIHHRDGGAGTLGCVVTKQGDERGRYILGNCHVLARSGYARKGDPIMLGAEGGKKIAELDDWCGFVEGEGYLNVVDAAIAKLDDAVSIGPEIEDLGMPTGVSYFVDRDMEIRVHGAGSGATRSAKILDANFHGRLDYYGPAGGRTLGFRDQFLTDPVNEPGDSGAVALNSRRRIVGLHCWGSDSVSVYNKIRNVCDQLGVQPVVSDAMQLVPAPAVAYPMRRPPVAERVAAIDVLARTLWGEARGEPDAGKEAVACVILNRAFRGKPRWPATIEAVCREPKQFSCWNPDDPNFPLLGKVDAGDEAFARCREIATRAVDGLIADTTRGSLHYVARGTDIWWIRGKAPALAIGRHVFYNNVA